MSETHHVRRSHIAAIVFLGACFSGLLGAVVPNSFMPAAPEKGSAKGQQVAHRVSPETVTRLFSTVAPVSTRSVPAVGTQIASIDVQKVRQLYQNLGYDLKDIAGSDQLVPRVFLASVPKGLHEVADSDVRKVLFLRTMLPLVLKVNEDITADRDRLEAIIDRQQAGKPLHPNDQTWLKQQCEAYGLSSTNSHKLLLRMDIVPPSLALAQAAEESGWGTSRFARLGNALFGQWTWNHSMGIRPRDAGPNASHSVRRFPTLMDAVKAYVRNLNSHRAYAAFRRERAALRKQGKPLSGALLANTLTRYSQRGSAYVSTLHVIMKANNLSALDNAQLSPAPVEMASLETGD